MAQLLSAKVVLIVTDLAGGFPGHIDAMRQYLQSPVMVKRVPAEVREQFLTEDFPEIGADGAGVDVLTTESPAPAQSVVVTGFRRTDDGKPVVGAYQIKAALQQAARALYTTTSKPSIYQMARAITYNLEVLPNNSECSDHLIILEDVGSERQVEISQIISHPRNPSIKVPIIRRRQVLASATVRCRFLVLAAGQGLLLRDELEDLIMAAGRFVGLGTDRGYGYGRFLVDDFAWAGAASQRDTEQVRAQAESEPHRKGIRKVTV